MFSAVSVRRAIWVGTLTVNGPVFVLLILPLSVFAWLVKHRVVDRDYNWIGLPIFILSFVAAWTWWSFAVPRWRVWAYERVEDIAHLKEQAVAVGLTWPDGHSFSRTEIKSRAVKQRESSLEAKVARASSQGIHGQRSEDDA